MCLLISDDTSSSAVNVSILDFERSVLLHLPKFKPKQVIVYHCTIMIVKLSVILSYSHSKHPAPPLGGAMWGLCGSAGRGGGTGFETRCITRK